MMSAPGDDARACRRTERRRVHIAISQPVLRQSINVRRVNRRAVTAQLPEASVIEHDEEYIRRAFFRAQWRGPGRTGFSYSTADAAGERRPGFVFDHCAICGAGVLFFFRHLILLVS